MSASLMHSVAEIFARRVPGALWDAAAAVRTAEQAERVSIAAITGEQFTIVAHDGWNLLASDATLPPPPPPTSDP